MPTYQYVCTECGEALEAVQSFTDAALTTCPGCGGRLRKVFSAVGVVFKGSGFYRNDSRSGSSSGTSGEPIGAPAEHVDHVVGQRAAHAAGVRVGVVALSVRHAGARVGRVGRRGEVSARRG